MLVHVLLGLRARFSTCTLLKHHTVSTIVSHQGYAYILLLYHFVIIIYNTLLYLAELSPCKKCIDKLLNYKQTSEECILG